MQRREAVSPRAMCAGASPWDYIDFWGTEPGPVSNTVSECYRRRIEVARMRIVEGQRIRPGALVLGTLMLVSFIQVGQHLPFQSTGGVALGHLSMLELRFWMSHALLLVPGVLLIGWALAPAMVGSAEGLWNSCLALSEKKWLALACAYFLLLLTLAVVGRSIFLLDLPITGDEYAVRFGARIWASGRLAVPILQPDGAFVQDFTYRYDGMVTAFEYPGVIFISALSMVTGLGSLLYALMAAATGVLVASAAGIVMGRRGTIVAALSLIHISEPTRLC